MDQPDRILRWKEVAARVGLSRTTVWRLAKSGQFPAAVKLTGSATGWKESSISDWLASRQSSTV